MMTLGGWLYKQGYRGMQDEDDMNGPWIFYYGLGMTIALMVPLAGTYYYLQHAPEEAERMLTSLGVLACFAMPIPLIFIVGIFGAWLWFSMCALSLMGAIFIMMRAGTFSACKFIKRFWH